MPEQYMNISYLAANIQIKQTGLHNIYSVSYTHLDVYKRQHIKYDMLINTKKSNERSDYTKSVSYTHLDVYKRQEYCYAEAEKEFWEEIQKNK